MKRFEVTLIPETKTLRHVILRIDYYGIYFLCEQEGNLVAGVSYQWPTFIQRHVNGEDAAMHLVPGLSGFSWDAQETIEYWERNDPWWYHD